MTKRIKLNLTLLLLALFSLTTVHAQEPKLIDISPENFTNVHTLSANGVLTIILKKGENQKLEVETSTAYNHDYTVSVVDSELRITGAGQPKSDMKIIFTYSELFLIKTKGPAIVKSEGIIECDEFRINANGASNVVIEIKTTNLNTEAEGAARVVLSGEAAVHNIKAGGVANINAYDLNNDTTHAIVSGAANVKVNSAKRLKGQVSGVAELRYKGEPESLEVENSGTSSLSRVDKTDTTRIRIGKSKVIIIDDKEGRKRRRTRPAKFNGHWGGLELGVNALLTPENTLEMPVSPNDYSLLDLKLNRSIAVGINLIESNYNLIGNKLGMLTGLGLEYNNYRFDNDVVLSRNANEILLYRDTLNKSLKSKLTVTYLTVPLILEYQTNSKSRSNSMHIGVGVIGGLRLGSYTKMVNDNDGKKEKIKTRDDFHLSPFKYELTARVGWGKMNLFANYALSQKFKKNKGPELHPLTLGIALLSW